MIKLSASHQVVDYDDDTDCHQFSLFDQDKRIIWLAAENNKVIIQGA